MIKEFPEVFNLIAEILYNQDLYYLDATEYRSGIRVDNRHPMIRFDEYGFMKFGQYFQNEEYVAFHVYIMGAKNAIGVLKFSDNKLGFYKIGEENSIRDFNIKLLDELLEEFTKPLLQKLEDIKNGIYVKRRVT